MFDRLRKIKDAASSSSVVMLLIPVGMALVYRGVKAMGEKANEAQDVYEEANRLAVDAEERASAQLDRLNSINEALETSRALQDQLTASFDKVNSALDDMAHRLENLDRLAAARESALQNAGISVNLDELDHPER